MGLRRPAGAGEACGEQEPPGWQTLRAALRAGPSWPVARQCVPVPLPAATPMPEKSIEKTRIKLARLYGIGLLVFVAVFGFLTLLVLFLSSLKLS